MGRIEEKDLIRLEKTLCGQDLYDNERYFDHRYYVYGLFVEDKPYPFYIGKGQGARVFQHEEECDKIIQSINNGLDEDVLDVKTSEKLKEILKNNGNITKVIIKWGLTSDEAYMCESALINLYQYMAETEEGKKLTNAVNGHASDLEKANKAGTTKAWSVQDFLDNCALEELDISAGARGEPPIKYPVIFIRINKLYEKLILKNNQINDEEIKKTLKEITRGCWNISNEIYEYIKYSKQTGSNKDPIYIAGIYQQVVKCIYKVEDIFGSEDFKNGTPDKDEYIQRNDPQHFLDLEWLEYQCCSEITGKGAPEDDVKRFVQLVKDYNEHQFSFDEKCTMHCDKCDCCKEKCNLKQYYGGKEAEKHLTQWKKRKYFIVSDDVPEKLEDTLMNKLITCTNDPSYLSSAQNPISRNFDIKVRSKNKEKPYDINQRNKTWFLTNHITKKLSGTKKPLKDISDFLDKLLCDELKYLSRCEKKDKNLTLKECLSEEESKEVATINNKYYKLNDILTVEEFDRQFDNKFHETVKKESEQSKKNKS